jgi:hypothetical protein
MKPAKSVKKKALVLTNDEVDKANALKVDKFATVKTNDGQTISQTGFDAQDNTKPRPAKTFMVDSDSDGDY